MLKIRRINVLLLMLSTLAACSGVQGCDKRTNPGKGANLEMKTHCIGRFSIALPTEMKLAARTAALRYVEIDEIVWPKDLNHEQARNAEWDKFMADIQSLSLPKDAGKVIINMHDFNELGKGAKGVFYYSRDDGKVGKWAILLDTGESGVWLKTYPVVVEREIDSNKSYKNIDNIAKSYQFISFCNHKMLPTNNSFYLKYGAIELPYSAQEESYARFEGHPLNLVLDIKMEMDFRRYRETVSLIEKTKELLSEAALMPGMSASKIRLGKRVVAGMKGEESILRMSDKGKKVMLFTWEFNGKEDSGEYPTTTIEMESPDGNLDEKMQIWDAVLDSMKPMFVRKK